MSNSEVLVVKVENAYNHPDADRLTIVEIGGYKAIANKLEDGTPRYKTGDLVVYIPCDAVLPEWMMKSMDFWDVNKNKPSFKKVKAKKLRGIFSEGILYPVDGISINGEMKYAVKVRGYTEVTDPEEMGFHDWVDVTEGDNVADFLGITKYEPVVPASMSGQLSGEYIDYAKVFDCENIKKYWSMFEDGEPVVATEKLHGCQMVIEYIPDLHDPLLFGETGSIAVTSKGVGAKGFIYKNLDANAENIWVVMLRRLLVEGLEQRLQEYVALYNDYRDSCIGTYDEDPPAPLKTIHLFGEIYGSGIQDLTYGQKTPTVNFFDMALNKEYLENDSFIEVMDNILELPRVPLLYSGPFNKEVLEGLKDGLDTISGSNIREGIVIKGNGRHPKYGRKVAKWVSENYLLRKGNTTEYQ